MSKKFVLNCFKFLKLNFFKQSFTLKFCFSRIKFNLILNPSKPQAYFNKKNDLLFAKMKAGENIKIL
jgi:hypothetical protein